MESLDTIERFVIEDTEFFLRLGEMDRYLYVGRHDVEHWHESKMSNAFVSACRNAKCVLDIGAHIGWYTCLIGKIAPQARLYVFEIDPENARALRFNIALNEIKYAQVFQVGVCERHRDAATVVKGKSTLESRLGPSMPMTPDPIWTISIDGWCAETKAVPDLVKIDVEGAEEAVLAGMKETIRRSRPVLFVEVHDAMKAANCKEFLRSEKYVIEAISLGDASGSHWCNQVLFARAHKEATS